MPKIESNSNPLDPQTSFNMSITSVSLGSEVENWSTLKSITLTVNKGTLLGVCGAVGAGKSSLLSAVLGYMDVLKGSVHVVPSIAYVAQQAWILSDTLRNNITFGLVGWQTEVLYR